MSKRKESEEDGLGEINLNEFKVDEELTRGEEELGKLGALRERVETIEFQLKDLLEDLPMKIEDKVYPGIHRLVVEETKLWLEKNLKRKIRLWVTWATITFLLSLATLNILLILKSSFM